MKPASTLRTTRMKLSIILDSFPNLISPIGLVIVTFQMVVNMILPKNWLKQNL